MSEFIKPTETEEIVEAVPRRERRQLERAEQSASARRSRTIRRVLLWTGAVCVLVGLAWGMGQLVSDVPAPLTGTLSIPSMAQDHRKGAESAPLVLVEYSDLQCPACAYFQPILAQLLAEPDLAGKITLVFRHFPLYQIHPNARQASYAAEAAAVQGKFWEYHDYLFEKQSEWSPLSASAARTKFIAYASSLGIDTAQFERDIASDAVRAKVEADADSGEASGVNGTPTFFLNGKQLSSPKNFEEFKNNFTNALQ